MIKIIRMGFLPIFKTVKYEGKDLSKYLGFGGQLQLTKLQKYKESTKKHNFAYGKFLCSIILTFVTELRQNLGKFSSSGLKQTFQIKIPIFT